MTETKTITHAIETFGGDFSRWPDRDLAHRAMEQSLSDRGIRSVLDDARALDHGLNAVRTTLDNELGSAAQRVFQTAIASVAPKPFGRWRLAAAAAVLVTAAGLGSVADIGLGPNDEGLTQVVVVDPLVFGPLAGDDQ